ncbi:hypothetical protein LCGC14_0355480 [marine sediment metagenome]|uniref:DUF6362 domain-containing protein n=1 Tax=marine sediment metagenome TaxID=412755 RepID=A0A0F9WHV7_9ZZZZ
MPLPIREHSESYNWLAAQDALARSTKYQATAAEIDRMDEVLSWNKWLTRLETTVIWGMAERKPVKEIGRKIARGRYTVHRIMKGAMGKIIKNLRKKG